MLNGQRDLVCPYIFDELRADDVALDAQSVACNYLYILKPRSIARRFEAQCPHHYGLSRVQKHVRE